jgi:hypothetical protein
VYKNEINRNELAAHACEKKNSRTIRTNVKDVYVTIEGIN